MPKPWFLTSALLLASALPCQVHAYGQVAEGSGVMSYERTNGERVRAEVLDVEGDRVRMKLPVAGGSVSRTYEIADFTPPSIYLIRLATAGDSAPAHLDLARYALQTGQIDHARRSLMTARELASDPTLGADVEKALAAAPAQELEKKLRMQLDKGDMSGAERSLRTMRSKYGAVVGDQHLAELQRELEARGAQREAETVAAQATREQQQVVEARERKLAPLQKRLDTARMARQKGLESSKNISTASGLFGTAIRHCEYVRRQAESLQRSAANDAVMTRELALLVDQAKQLEIDCLLSDASLHTTRGSFNAALGEVNKVLALDADNQQALAMRGRIELAANRGWGTGWGW